MSLTTKRQRELAYTKLLREIFYGIELRIILPELKIIDHVLLTLSPREEEVLRLRFGLDDGASRTLESIGAECHVSRQRIFQIQEKALRKLRQEECLARFVEPREHQGEGCRRDVLAGIALRSRTADPRR